MSEPITRRALLQAGGLGALAALANACAAPVARGALHSSTLLAAPLAPAPRRPLLAPLRPQLPIPDVPLEVKIGQMIMLGFHGPQVNDQSTIIRAIRDYHIGSTVLFGHNVSSPGQVMDLTSALQAASEQPLLIAVDQEGGLVNRFGSGFGFSSNYSAQELGARNDLVLSMAQGESIGQRLAALGINLNLAPVVDLNLNPANPVIGGVQRSFSADPEVVTQQSKVLIQSHHHNNVLCTLKHFPGHGSSQQDSHLGFVDVTDSWQAIELTPYRQLIQSGLCDVIMTAHIFNAKLDDTYPATLSRRIVTGILREQLGYNGVIMSDDLQMRAISQLYDFETAVQLAVAAGVDIIAISNNLSYADNWAERTVATVLDLVTRGQVSAERIDQSYRRVMNAKQRLQPLIRPIG